VQQDNKRWHNKTKRKQEGGTSKGNATTSWHDERARGLCGAQQEDKER
jgi:hypothetical protein